MRIFNTAKEIEKKKNVLLLGLENRFLMNFYAVDG